jgi:hypothetical protein
MLKFIQKWRFLFFSLLVIPLIIGSINITNEENLASEIFLAQEERELAEQSSFESLYLNNHSYLNESTRNIFSKTEINGKKITFSFPQKTNNQLGDLIKFINDNSYNALLHLPIGYQSGKRETQGIITFDYFKAINLNINSFVDISNNGILGTKLMNIEGTLVSTSTTVNKNSLFTKRVCKNDLEDSWKECPREITEIIKNGYVSSELINKLLERTSTTGYKIHEFGEKLFYIQLYDDNRSYLFRCKNNIPDGAKGDDYQCENPIGNKLNIDTAGTLQIDLVDNSEILFTSSGNIIEVDSNLQVDYLIDIALETESNLYYFSEYYLNTKIFGHYSSGSLRTYGTQKPFVEIYKPRAENRPSNGREMTSFGHLNGNEFYGVYPWGELWIRDLFKNETMLELVDNTNAGEYVFPFEGSLKNLETDLYDKLGYDFLSQRINSIVPCFQGICISINNKRPSGISGEEYEYLLQQFPELNQYGKIYYLPGDKQICTYTDTHLKSLEILIQDTKIILRYNDTECVLNNPNDFEYVELLTNYSLELKNYVFIEEIDS